MKVNLQTKTSPFTLQICFMTCLSSLLGNQKYRYIYIYYTAWFPFSWDLKFMSDTFFAIYMQYKPRSMPHYWMRLLPNCPKSLSRGPDFFQQKSIQLSVVTQKPCHCCSLRVIFTKHFPERKINEKQYYNNVRFFSQFGMLSKKCIVNCHSQMPHVWNI